jgi:hypothetical protein
MMKATHAVVTLIVGLTVGMIWLKTFWRNPNSVPASIIAMPIAAAILGLGHWVAYDFAIGHWAGDFSLIQALFNVGVALALQNRRSERAQIAA